VTPAEQFLANLSLIERVIAYTAARHRLSRPDRDEFASYARLKLIDDDYRILRQFGGRAKLTTYLTTVVERLFLDFRVSQWGKWRPSSEARRLGPLAIQLERLVTRDRLTRDEAFEQLQSALPEPPTRDELEDLYARLPVRLPKQMVSEDVLMNVPVAGSHPEEQLLTDARAVPWKRAITALKAAIAALDPAERTVIVLRYQGGLTVSRIATMLNLEAKPLYRRIERVNAQLRMALEAAGVSAEDVHELLQEPGDPAAERVRGAGLSRPSH
jgi:RNA polymerase sigma factor (sigma-70 family)